MHRGNRSLSQSHFQSCQLEWHSFTIVPMAPNDTTSFMSILDEKFWDIENTHIISILSDTNVLRSAALQLADHFSLLPQHSSVSILTGYTVS